MVCNVCGTAHAGITRTTAERLVNKHKLWDAAMEGLDPNIADYEHCGFCGNSYADFSASNAPAGKNYIIVERNDE